MKFTAALMSALILIGTQSALPEPVYARSLIGVARGALAKRAASPGLRATSQQLSATRPRDVVISRSRYPQAAAHIDHAQRNGQPTILHIDRAAAKKNRRASTGHVKLNPKPAAGYERDEYPPAFTREGGHNANVRFIDRHDNRGAGASMRAQTQRLKDQSKVRVLVGP
jgi:hypothetical protein